MSELKRLGSRSRISFTMLWYGFLLQEAQTSTYQKRDVNQRELIYDGTGK